MAQRTQLDDSNHPLLRKPMPACSPTAWTALAKPYVILDARYERVRNAGRVVDCAVLIAIGVTASGHRRVLGVSVALSEAEVHWRAFLDSLIERGLRGVNLNCQ